MSDLIRPKRSAVPGKVPDPTDLEVGELALNTADGALFTKHTDGSVKRLGGEVASAFFRRETVTATTNGQTEFVVPGGFTPGAVLAFIGGAEQIEFDDSDGVSVVFTEGRAVGEVATFYIFSAFEVADAVSMAAFSAAIADIEEQLGSAGGVWETQPIGVPFPIWTHLAGVSVPPTDNPNYRYIKLTASDGYNTGVLTGESVSGSAPLVQATASINDPDGPMHGASIRLINTERRAIRAGLSGVVEGDALQNLTGSFRTTPNYVSGALLAAGVFAASDSADTGGRSGGTAVNAWSVTFDASRVARTSTETRAKNIGADFYMRIR